MTRARDIAEEIVKRYFEHKNVVFNVLFNEVIEVVAKALSDYAEERVREALLSPDPFITEKFVKKAIEQARAEALEEAAKICESSGFNLTGVQRYILSKSIRALIPHPPEGK